MAQIAPQPTGPTRTARTPGDHDEQAAHLFGLLANRRRLEMIRLLADRELDVGQLAQQLGITNPTSPNTSPASATQASSLPNGAANPSPTD